MKNLNICSVPLFFFFIFSACSSAVSSDKTLETLIIKKSGGEMITYHVEVADTDTARHLGLMYRDKLPADQGMLLDFPRDANVGIWMKNTYIPLDLIFIDGMGTIVTFIRVRRRYQPGLSVPVKG